MKIYHLKLEDENNPYTAHTLCNRSSSDNWLKYSKENFQKGRVFNFKLGKEIKIEGRPCKRCLNLL